MDYFAIVSFDVADSSDGRKKAVDEHRARLEELDQAGRLRPSSPPFGPGLHLNALAGDEPLCDVALAGTPTASC